MVSREGLKAELVKVDKIRQWPRFKTGTGLASFLGLSNYYRTLVPSFAHVSDSFYNTSMMKVIDWTADVIAKFEELKTLMLSAPVVRLPDVEKDFIVKTDGSKVTVGAVLNQRFDDTGLEHPVGFFSRALSGLERNYAAYELEMYAVVRAVEHFRMFFLGKEFSCVRTTRRWRNCCGEICFRLLGSSAGYFGLQSIHSTYSTSVVLIT